MKKTWIALAIMLFVCVFTISAFAQEERTELLYEERYLSSQDPRESLDDTVDIDALTDHLREQLKKCVKEIDIASFNIKRMDNNSAAIRDIIYDTIPEAFHVLNFSLGYMEDTYVSVYVNYIYSIDEYSEMLAKFEAAAEELVSDIKNNSSLSDLTKALLLHDRLALVCEYDKANYNAGTIPDISYTSYGALVNGVAVCQGYAEAYLYLLDKVGIDSYLCSSSALSHAWNIVTIDGETYHVDVTWDDPTWDTSGRVYHSYFMCSTQNFLQSHTANDYDTAPDDTRYDGYFWNNSSTAFVLLDGEVYYIDTAEQKLKTYDGTVLADVTHKWRAGPTSVWRNNYARLATDGKTLYFNLSDAVYSFDVDMKTTQKVFEPEHSFGEYFYIYGMRFDGERIVCELNNSPNFDDGVKANYTVYYELPKLEQTESGYGDVNNDGVVDGKDLVRLKKYISAFDFDTGVSSVSVGSGADATGDGFIDGKDLVRIKKYIAAFDFDTGTSSVPLGPVA